MAIPKKNSRTIAVGGIRYRYKVSTTRQDQDGNFNLNVTIERENTKACVLRVLGLVTRDYWLDFSDHGTKHESKAYPTVTPKHVAVLITLALDSGWQAGNRVAAFELSVKNEDLFG